MSCDDYCMSCDTQMWVSKPIKDFLGKNFDENIHEIDVDDLYPQSKLKNISISCPHCGAKTLCSLL